MKITNTLLLVVITIGSGNLYAQTLPKIQQGGLKAPTNVKVDGSIVEWGNNFEANSPANRFYYSIANDDKNLYLVVKMQDATANFKAIKGGIHLTIFAETTKSISFPHFKNGNEQIHDYSHKGLYYSKNRSPENLKALDSVFLAGNKLAAATFKEIDIVDEKGLPLQTLSLYNEFGIRAAGRFDKDMHYVLEMSIPLKYLGLDAHNNLKFKYNLGLIATNDMRNGKGPIMRLSGNGEPDILYQMHRTDLVGEYVLVK